MGQGPNTWRWKVEEINQKAWEGADQQSFEKYFSDQSDTSISLIWLVKINLFFPTLYDRRIGGLGKFTVKSGLDDDGKVSIFMLKFNLKIF